jgi:hypothetical protein
LQDVPPSAREKLRAIVTNQVVFDHLADRRLSLDDALKLNIQKSAKPSDVFKEIATLQAAKSVMQDNNLTVAQNDSCKSAMS